MLREQFYAGAQASSVRVSAVHANRTRVSSIPPRARHPGQGRWTPRCVRWGSYDPPGTPWIGKPKASKLSRACSEWFGTSLGQRRPLEMGL